MKSTGRPEQQQFARRVEAFLVRTGMAMSRFGALACNDRNFVAELRGGEREIRGSTIDKVDAWMTEFEGSADGRHQIRRKAAG